MLDISADIVFVLLAGGALVVALWPRLVYWQARLSGHRSRPMPAGLTPISAGAVSGLNITRLLVCGLIWVETREAGQFVGRTTAPSRAEENLIGAVADGSRRDSQGNWRVRLRSVRTLMETNAQLAAVEARDLGLFRDRESLVRAMRVLAIGEMVGSVVVAGLAAPEVGTICAGTLLAGLFTLWISYHIDPHSSAGGRLAVDLERLRRRFQEVGAAATSIDNLSMRSIIPGARNAGQTEAWAVAVGCHSQHSDQVAAAVWEAAREGPSLALLIGLLSRALLALVKSPFKLARRLILRPQGRPGGAMLW